jgi:hypothetical protein
MFQNLFSKILNCSSCKKKTYKKYKTTPYPKKRNKSKKYRMVQRGGA